MEICCDIPEHHFFAVSDVDIADLKLHSGKEFLKNWCFRQVDIFCSELIKESFSIGKGGVAVIKIQLNDDVVDLDGVHFGDGGEAEIGFVENPVP